MDSDGPQDLSREALGLSPARAKIYAEWAAAQDLGMSQKEFARAKVTLWRNEIAAHLEGVMRQVARLNAAWVDLEAALRGPLVTEADDAVRYMFDEDAAGQGVGGK
jgi:hypothetical protein